MSWLILYEPILVGMLVLVAVSYELLLPYAVAAALLLRLVTWVGGKPLRFAPFHIPLILLLSMVAVSAWVTPLPRVTAQESFRLLLGVFFCLSLVNNLDERTLNWALAGIFILVIALATSGLFFANWADKFRFLPHVSMLLPRLQSVLDTAMNPNVIGGILAIMLAWLMTWTIFRWSNLQQLTRLGWMVALLFITGVLFLTQARASLLALAAGLCLMVILRWRRSWIMLVFGLVIVLLFFIYIGPQQVWYVFGGETGGVTTLVGRENIWLRAKLMIQDFPFTGVGMGTFGVILDVLFPLAAQPVHINHAHNIYLQIAADLGLPGLVAWLGCWSLVLWNAWRLYQSKIQFWRALGAAALCSQVTLGVGGLLDCAVWDTRPAIIIWGLWGLVLVAGQVLRSFIILETISERRIE